MRGACRTVGEQRCVATLRRELVQRMKRDLVSWAGRYSVFEGFLLRGTTPMLAWGWVRGVDRIMLLDLVSPLGELLGPSLAGVYF